MNSNTFPPCSWLLISIACWSLVGCDKPQPPAERPQRPTPTAGPLESTEPVTSPPEATATPQAPPANEPAANTEASANPKVPVATKAETPQDKTADPPLDPNIDVERLLAARLPGQELDLGWIRLFDGQSLMGWRDAGKADWHVENSEIVATSGEPGLLVTDVRFGDYELELEYLGDETTNSGVFLRTPDQPTDPKSDCYELNIAPPDNPFPTGSLVGRAKASEQVDAPESGQWHTLHALVDQAHVQVWVNGEQTVDYQDDTGLVAGKIGLQFREGTIRFRNIRLRPIGYRVLPGANPSDWNEPKGDIQSRFTDAGTLAIEGGRGHMELLQPHANVILQAKALTQSENTNSGIFFRCIPGEDMNGYECQIHHGYKEDRRRPVDAGSGAIFRRQNAKAVLSDEGSPVHLTIIADGPNIATWVEGVQVVQWQDTRAANPNPRKGLRTEAGTIMLQGHDPGTKIEFLGLSISPLP
jgi:hypothetical protein